MYKECQFFILYLYLKYSWLYLQVLLVYYRLCYKKWNHLLMKSSIHLFYDSTFWDQTTGLFFSIYSSSWHFSSAHFLLLRFSHLQLLQLQFSRQYTSCLVSHSPLHLLSTRAFKNTVIEPPHAQVRDSLLAFFSDEALFLPLHFVFFHWRTGPGGNT